MGETVRAPRKLVIGKEADEAYINRIRDSFPILEIITCREEEEQELLIRDADVLLTRILPKDPGIAPHLKWVHFIWEGVDTMSDKFRSSDVLLTNSSGAHTVHIAEHVMMYLLILSRKVFMYNDYQKRSEWLGWWDQPELRKLNGTTIGIIGYGRIGRAVARIADGFGMDVIAVKRTPSLKSQSSFHSEGCCDMEGSIPKVFYGLDEMDMMLDRCDSVVLSLPLTDETCGIFGKEQFIRMKDSAYFINIGRGGLVDEPALIEALENNEIGGAGLDVFSEEPLSSSSPLWKMDNVVITPHSSVGGDPSDNEVLDLFIENMERFMKGERMLNLVDKSRGY